MYTIQEQRERMHISNLSLTRDLGTNGALPQNGRNGFLSHSESDTDDETDTDNESVGIIQRFRMDIVFRGKLIQTFWLGFAFFFLGWSVGSMGPSFPDLQMILNTDLETASWLFTAGALGYLVGSCIGGVAFDRFNKRLLLGCNMIGMAVTNGLIPWCKSFWVMISMMVLCGGFEGSLETGGNADIVATWGSEGSSAMLAIHFAYSAGGIISPFVLEPFLAREMCEDSVISDLVANNLTSTTHMSVVANVHHNITAAMTSDGDQVSNDLFSQYLAGANTTEILTKRLKCETKYGETRIHYAFLIACVMTLIAAVPFFVMYMLFRNSDKKTEQDVEVNACAKPSRPEKLPFKLKVISLILMCSIMFIYTTIEDNLNGFMMTFCITYFHWPKAYGTLANSLNWASFAVGRLTGIIVVQRVRTCTVLYVHISVMILSFVGMLVASLVYKATFLWAFIPLAGISLSVIMPSLFTWTEERILPVSGKISSLYLVTGSAGAMLSPLLFGYLMEQQSSLWYVHLLLGFSFLSLILFSIIRFIELFCIRPLVTEVDTVEESVNKDLIVTGKSPKLII